MHPSYHYQKIALRTAICPSDRPYVRLWCNAFNRKCQKPIKSSHLTNLCLLKAKASKVQRTLRRVNVKSSTMLLSTIYVTQTFNVGV